MLRLILRRLLTAIPTLGAIVSLSFFVIRLAPGSPFATERNIPPEVRQALERRYHFDEPMFRQYLRYMKNLVFHLDLGLSTKYPRFSISELVAMSLPHTLLLGVTALVWALLVGLSAGVVGAIRQNTRWDYGAMGLAMIGISLPTFVLGPLLVLCFSLSFFWLPPAGWGGARHLVLPAITLGTVYAAYLARLTRSGMLEVIRQDFVRTVMAKGLPERLVLMRHALRGGLMPVVSFLGPMLAQLFTGSVVVEMIFNVPGMGPYFVTAAANRDYFLVMGLVLVYSTLLIFMNLVVDILYGILDPRIRHS
jgi:oligopeptide transport system permease protein